MNVRTIVSAFILSLAGFLAMWAFLTVRYANADDVPAPGPAAAMLFDAGTVDAAPTSPATTSPQFSSSPPDPETEIAAFLRIAWTVGKASLPAAAVFVAFAIVTVGRRRWPPASQGTTGILTATLLTALTYAVSMLATGASVGTALGGAVVALLTGRAIAMRPAVK